MIQFNPTNPTLLQRAEKLASIRGVAVETILEEALQRYLPAAEGEKAAVTDLPVAQAIQFVDPSVVGKSYGKILEVLDQALSLEKLR